MSEERKPVYTVSFRKGRRCTVKIEIFGKNQWTGDPADTLLYRCRINRKWFGGTHGNMTFMNAGGVLTLIRRSVAEGGVV
jgi:hypothetical protein